MKLPPVPRRSQGPPQKVLGVIESEGAAVVLHVVLVEQVVDFRAFVGVGDVDFYPLEAFGHVVRVGAQLGRELGGDDGFVPVGIGGCGGAGGLGGVFVIEHGLYYRSGA